MKLHLPVIRRSADPPDDVTAASMLAQLDPMPYICRQDGRRELVWEGLIGFRRARELADSRALVSSIVAANALEEASATLESLIASQDGTVGNIRSRAASILGSATIAVTLATTVGLLSVGDKGGGVALSAAAGWWLLGLSVALVAVISLMQLPLTWALGAGTDVLGNTLAKENIAAARVLVMEVGARRNAAQLGTLSKGLILTYLILGAEVVVVLLAIRGVIL